MPRIPGSAYVAPSATVDGDVSLGGECSIWFGAVLRGDEDSIAVGSRSNVQDNAVVHVDDGFPVEIGERVSVGHGAVVHGATVGDDCLVGMNATVLNGASIDDGCLVAAGAVVTEGFEAEPGSLLAGVPARRVGDVSDEHRRYIEQNWREYVEMSRERLGEKR
ncbi:MAG: Carbonic anhydrase [Methanonatronarchaeales archaeon]|nr:Carbonic anhydrase [Methanonatronarchaeales archaeon]